MLITYPVIVHKDENSCYGVTVPDLPGCFSAGDTYEEALVNAENAIYMHLLCLQTDEDVFPEPSKNLSVSDGGRIGFVKIDTDLVYD